MAMDLSSVGGGEASAAGSQKMMMSALTQSERFKV